MAKTPEGKVKDEVRDALHAEKVFPFLEVGQGLHPDAVGTYYMPVAGPYAVHGIHDFVGLWSGRFFSIETKAPKAKDDETIHQGLFRSAVTAAGGVALTGVRDGAAGVAKLKQLLEA